MDAEPQPRPTPRKWGRFRRFFIGATALLVFLLALYGPEQVAQMLLLAVVCTVGIGLIPIIFVSWLVGWILTTAWDAFSASRPAPATS